MATCGSSQQSCCRIESSDSDDGENNGICNRGYGCNNRFICIPCGNSNQPCCDLRLNSNECENGLICQFRNSQSLFRQCRNTEAAANFEANVYEHVGVDDETYNKTNTYLIVMIIVITISVIIFIAIGIGIWCFCCKGKYNQNRRTSLARKDIDGFNHEIIDNNDDDTDIDIDGVNDDETAMIALDTN